MSEPTDTDPSFEADQAERWRSMTGSERVEHMVALNRMAVSIAEHRQRAWYPDDTAEERRLRRASLWLPREAMIRWWGWDPETRGR